MADRSIKVTLQADVNQFNQGMKDAAKAVEGVGTQATGVAKSGEGFMSRMSQSAREQRAEWSQVGGTLTGVGASWTALNALVAKTGIEYNTLQQTSRAALKSILGDSEAVNAQMDKLDAFAKTSPFSKATFIEAQQQMLAFGVESEKVIGYLSAINDATAAAGGNNQTLSELAFVMAQISAAGKITGQDLIQFGQRGVNAAELIGSQMGKTGAQIRQDITDNALDANDALDALAAGMSERFAGASANVKETMGGALDRVTAAWRDLSAEIMASAVSPDGGGWLVDLTNSVADFMRGIQSLPDNVKEAGAILSGIGGTATLAAGGFMLLAPRLLESWDAMKRLGLVTPGVTGVLGTVGRAAGIAAAGFALINAAVGQMVDERQGIEGVSAAIERLSSATGSMRDLESALPETYVLGVKASGDTLIDVYKEIQYWESGFLRDGLVNNTFQAMFDAVGWTTAETRAKETFAAIDAAIKSLDPDQASAAFAEIAESMALQGVAAEDLLRFFPEYVATVEAAAEAAGVFGLTNEEIVAGMTGQAEAIRLSNGAWADYGAYPPEIAKSLEAAAAAEKRRAEATAEATEETWSAVDAAIEYNNMINGMAGNALSVSAAEMAVIEARQKATETIKENGEATDLNTEKGRENRRALDDMASAALSLRDKQMMAGEEIGVVNGTMRESREAFRRAAEAAGYTASEVDELVRQYGLIPARVATEITADTSQAEAAARALMDRLNRMSATVRVNATIRNLGQAPIWTGGRVGDVAEAYGLAAGGSPSWVNQSGRVSGPGTPTSDSVNARISRDEFVMNGAASQYYGYDAMYALNAKRIPREWFQQLGYASGGTPARTYTPTYQPSFAAPGVGGGEVHVHHHYGRDSITVQGIKTISQLERALERSDERAQQRGVRRG